MVCANKARLPQLQKPNQKLLPPEFIWNAAKNCVHPLEGPFRNNVRRGRVWVCRDIIIRMPQGLRIKRYLKSCSHSLSQSSPLIFRVKPWMNLPSRFMLNSLWVGRSILVQRSKVNLALSSQLKRKPVMETIEAVKVGLSQRNPTTILNTRSYSPLSPSQTSNNCLPQRDICPPRQSIPNKCGKIITNLITPPTSHTIQVAERSQYNTMHETNALFYYNKKRDAPFTSKERKSQPFGTSGIKCAASMPHLHAQYSALPKKFQSKFAKPNTNQPKLPNYNYYSNQKDGMTT